MTRRCVERTCVCARKSGSSKSSKTFNAELRRAANYGRTTESRRGKPKHAVAYHFQNDFDTLPATVRTVESIYDGPVDYARDFMVWNVTKDGVRTRMAVPNPEYYPSPPLQEKKIEAGGDRYQTPEWVLDGFPDEVDAVAKEIYADFNRENGTDYKFQLK